MNRILAVGFVATVLALSSGCAANAQCMRHVNDLEAQSREQDRQIADLEARQAKLSAEQAGTTLTALASESWDAAKSAFGWAKAEAPLAAHAVSEDYKAAHERLTRAQQCYRDHGGNDAHTYEEYKAIATACLNSN
jgi:peptidoglycan hydrolase CwlO-like protein